MNYTALSFGLMTAVFFSLAMFGMLSHLQKNSPWRLGLLFLSVSSLCFFMFSLLMTLITSGAH